MAKDSKTPRHRSGAVAQMLHMPVATLRVWERRYQVSQAILTASGQRLYSPADVQRLALLKQLTDLGHAIGSLAALDMPELLEVAATHAGAENLSQVHRPAPAPPANGAWRVAVIGPALARRLQRPALLQHVKRTLVLLGPFDDAAQADQALQGIPVDALLVHEPSLHADWLTKVIRDAPALQATPKALLYGFAADATCEALAQAGVALLREPQNDTVLAQWLQNMLSALSAARAPVAHPPQAPVADAAPPRRWTDAALAEFVSQSPTIACECPRHVAELLVQLSHFETYSAECENRSPADAALHQYLRETAAQARAQFEQALAHVAQLEGLTLPSPQAPHQLNPLPSAP
jgi:MerR family transcriptional regulator, light-induced transcriptional regulator